MTENEMERFINLIMYFILGHYEDFNLFLKYSVTEKDKQFILKTIAEFKKTRKKF